jgi:hypothetical protein
MRISFSFFFTFLMIVNNPISSGWPFPLSLPKIQQRPNIIPTKGKEIKVPPQIIMYMQNLFGEIIEVRLVWEQKFLSCIVSEMGTTTLLDPAPGH